MGKRGGPGGSPFLFARRVGRDRRDTEVAEVTEKSERRGGVCGEAVRQVTIGGLVRRLRG